MQIKKEAPISGLRHRFDEKLIVFAARNVPDRFVPDRFDHDAFGDDDRDFHGKCSWV